MLDRYLCIVFKSSRAVKHNLQICRTSKPPVNFLNSALMFGPTMSREKDMHSLQMLFSRMAYCKVGCKDDNKVSVQLAVRIRKSGEFFYRQHVELR